MRPPLAVSRSIDETTARDRSLFIEAGPDLDDAPPGDLVRAAHGPWYLPGQDQVRMHLGSTKPDVRSHAISLLETYIDGAHKMFPELQVVLSHPAPNNFPDPPARPGNDTLPLRPDLASWDLMVESFRQLARHCAGLGLTLVVENNWAYWDGIADDVDVTTLTPADFAEYFCTSPEQFLQLPVDVNEPNFAMALDPSHAGPYCHRWADVDQRREVLMRYLAHPERIGHFHWNDSDIANPPGRGDQHLSLDTGTLGDDFHRAIKQRALQLDHPVTIEHFYGPEALDKELAYIDAL